MELVIDNFIKLLQSLILFVIVKLVFIVLTKLRCFLNSHMFFLTHCTSQQFALIKCHIISFSNEHVLSLVMSLVAETALFAVCVLVSFNCEGILTLCNTTRIELSSAYIVDIQMILFFHRALLIKILRQWFISLKICCFSVLWLFVSGLDELLFFQHHLLLFTLKFLRIRAILINLNLHNINQIEILFPLLLIYLVIVHI